MSVVAVSVGVHFGVALSFERILASFHTALPNLTCVSAVARLAMSPPHPRSEDPRELDGSGRLRWVEEVQRSVVAVACAGSFASGVVIHM